MDGGRETSELDSSATSVWIEDGKLGSGDDIALLGENCKKVQNSQGWCDYC